MKGFEVVYAEKEFEVLRAGRERFFLRLKGGLKYAAPGLRRITRKEAETVIQEHITKEMKRGQVEAEEKAGRGSESGIAEPQEPGSEERRSGSWQGLPRRSRALQALRAL